MNNFSHVPPGFRFHPTDEELVDYYLRKKVSSRRIDLDVIKDVDLYKIEPWDLQELCRIGTEEQNEWYFFSHKDKKYPTGTRTNRATAAGFWKATGRDKAIYSKHELIGMRKTLVFYKDLPYHLHLPLENQKLLQSASNSITPYAVVEQNHVMHQVSIMHQVQHSAQQQNFQTVFGNSGNEQVADWRALDKYVASQLSQEDAPKENSFSNTNTNSTNNNNNMFLGKNNDNIEQFHPTDEELVDYYLRKKVSSRRIDLDVIKDVDLYKIEPWDLQELCRIGTEEQNEWYFFSHKDKKYPTGTRTNRATAAGFWKATGRDKAIYSKHELIGMRKTLVFYKGRAPNGQKSDWIMHEYRLETDENGTPQASFKNYFTFIYN
ncbi:hypothetical protein DEO72_LG6g117 [Vigna unguiculata]|uniref:NAC domain-containing protein n=1 Tax=Vigna unguiculata TaxID=3917 RepID=A0A4D6M608_VIGUN|nr:hypothetical protein DEO72_LG6g117 [Vigna unguiculata]